MSISTKTGDRGQTGLWSGERVWKDDIRVDAYGTVDELNSHIGEAKHYVESKNIFEILEQVQRELFKVGGQLATKNQEYSDPVLCTHVEKLTEWVHHFESLVELKGFVIPGSTVASAKLDICRTIARRAERNVITLARNEEVQGALIQYLNRLSDLLFIMARIEEEGKIKFKV